MTRLRSKLSYSNVVATLALILAIGGGSAFAATQLAKNSVGPRQLKKNAVTTAKIKPGAVTSAKIKLGTLGTVPTAAHATNASHADTATVASSIAPPESPRVVGTAGQPPFVAPWKNVNDEFAPVSFYKDREGVVHLEGLAEGNGTDVVIFTLPPGYRPNKKLFFSNFGYSGAQWPLYVEANGDVKSGSVWEISLSGITFRVE
jgi:hypothetical protein